MGWRERVQTRLAARLTVPVVSAPSRYWPTEKQRPGESVADYCRRLDVYENLRHGSVADTEAGAA